MPLAVQMMMHTDSHMMMILQGPSVDPSCGLRGGAASPARGERFQRLSARFQLEFFSDYHGPLLAIILLL